jgi:hypothetical protein
MNIYRIKIALATGPRFAYTGLFASGAEAILQTQADWPGARSITAMCLRRQA